MLREENKTNQWRLLMETILIIVVLVLLFGGGGGYFGRAEDIGDRTRSCSGVSGDAKATSPIRIAPF
jgi:hypothetical protein